MSWQTGGRLKYARNRLPKGWRFGRKVRDDNSSACTHEFYMVTDDFGNRVDGRKDTFDLDPKKR